jgi:hypothetical protein
VCPYQATTQASKNSTDSPISTNRVTSSLNPSPPAPPAFDVPNPRPNRNA